MTPLILKLGSRERCLICDCTPWTRVWLLLLYYYYYYYCSAWCNLWFHSDTCWRTKNEAEDFLRKQKSEMDTSKLQVKSRTANLHGPVVLVQAHIIHDYLPAIHHFVEPGYCSHYCGYTTFSTVQDSIPDQKNNFFLFQNIWTDPIKWMTTVLSHWVK